jgi:hypothetical protein
MSIMVALDVDLANVRHNSKMYPHVCFTCSLGSAAPHICITRIVSIRRRTTERSSSNRIGRGTRKKDGISRRFEMALSIIGDCAAQTRRRSDVSNGPSAHMHFLHSSNKTSSANWCRCIGGKSSHMGTLQTRTMSPPRVIRVIR